MRKRLQDWRESNYERPQLPFVCGLAAEGICCPLGPDGKGKCRDGAACLPVLEGDRWTCGRPNSMGGACEQGPSPDGLCCRTLSCQPVPSQRVQRGRWIAGCLLFTMGLIVVVLASNFRNEVLAPGPLTQAHAQIIRREDRSERCATCHPTGNGNLWEMCRVGLGLGEALGPPQWELCLKCHEKTIPREHALAAHSLPQNFLEAQAKPVLAAQPAARKGGFELPQFETKRNQLDCAICHREHHGAEHSLAALTNAQCQTCHQEQFQSLTHGHPEFQNWPYRHAARIQFNHRSHGSKHFVEAKRDFTCTACHVDDPEKSSKLLASFEQTCASCHGEKINASAIGGVVFLRLPSLDLEALAAAGEKLAWPAAASGDFDGRLPWEMQLLLAADAEVKSALPALGSDVDFANLNAENPADVAAAAKIARGIRRLFDDLATRGHVAVEERLQVTLTPEATSAQKQAVAAFTQGLSPETLGTLSSWFREESPLQQAAFNAEDDSLVSEEDQKELEKLPPGVTPKPLPAKEEPKAEETKPEESQQEEPTPAPPAEKSDAVEMELIDPGLLDPDLLVPDAVEPDLTEPPPTADARPMEAPSVASPQPAQPQPSNPLRNSTPSPAPPLLLPSPTPAPTPLSLPHAPSSWFADPVSLTLRYVPRGHGDPVLAAWLEAAVRRQTSPAAETTFLQATDPKSSGLCFQCHTTHPSGEATAGRTIAWHSQPFERRGFTKFSHRPHQIQPMLADCTHCHSLRSAISLTAREVNFSSPMAEPDFHPITKKSCVSCHTAGSAGDSCVQCHRYHVHLDAVSETRN